MPITNTDLFNLLVVGCLFNAGIIFMLLALLSKWPKSVALYLIAGLFFFVMGVTIPATATEFYPVGWLFLILGVFNLAFGMISGVGGLVTVYRQDEWEKEPENEQD